jgi:TonB family protein
MMRVLLAAVAAVFLIAAAPVMAPGTEADRDPDWLIKPDGALMARFYPVRAWRGDMEGRATIVCAVGLDTRLTDCTVQSEDPPGYGFGKAALDLAGEMRMAPAIHNGLPVTARVRVPLVFKLPEPPPPLTLPDVEPPTLFVLAGASLLIALLLLGSLIGAYRLFGRGRGRDR